MPVRIEEFVSSVQFTPKAGHGDDVEGQGPLDALRSLPVRAKNPQVASSAAAQNPAEARRNEVGMFCRIAGDDKRSV